MMLTRRKKYIVTLIFFFFLIISQYFSSSSWLFSFKIFFFFFLLKPFLFLFSSFSKRKASLVRIFSFSPCEARPFLCQWPLKCHLRLLRKFDYHRSPRH